MRIVNTRSVSNYIRGIYLALKHAFFCIFVTPTITHEIACWGGGQKTAMTQLHHRWPARKLALTITLQTDSQQWLQIHICFIDCALTVYQNTHGNKTVTQHRIDDIPTKKEAHCKVDTMHWSNLAMIHWLPSGQSVPFPVCVPLPFSSKKNKPPITIAMLSTVTVTVLDTAVPVKKKRKEKLNKTSRTRSNQHW